MPSPFPGMDPYLEGYLWPDVHHALAGKIRQQLAPRLKPRYVARLEIYVVEDREPQTEFGVMYPDVEVLTSRALREQAETEVVAPEQSMSELTAPLRVPLINPQVHITTVEVRDVAHNQLVTSIEILSPVNKRDPGRAAYLQKRDRLRQAGVHLLELDLLRRGMRTVWHPRIPDTPYRVTLVRAEAEVAEVWPIRLADRLPTVPVPLLAPDPDVPLGLGPALTTIYDEAAYDLSVDYGKPPPPPPLSAEEAEWQKTLNIVKG